MLDNELRYLVVSEQWRRDWDLSTQDLIGRNHLDVFPDLLDEWKDAIHRGLQGESCQSDFDEYPRKSGTLEYVRWKLVPWYDERDEVAGIVIFSELITEQVKTRKQLEQRDAHIANLFEYSPIGLNLCRMDGLWIQSNQAFLDIIGYNAEEANGGLTYWQLTPRSYDREEERQLRSLTETGRYGPYEKEFIHKDGHLVPVRLNGFLVNRDGEQYIWSLIEDITEMRQLQEALEQEHLQAIQASKLATLGEMAAGVAHELNNPLAVIQGFSDLLAVRNKNAPDAVIAEAVSSINTAVERSAHIIKGLLRFARDTSQDDLELHSATELIDEALSLTRTRFENHGIDLQIEVTSKLEMRCNAIGFSQILINLLQNAFDAIRDLESRWLRIEATDRENSTVELRVIDSGTGIDRETAERIFNPFFTTKDVGSGTGLGLSISRGIIEDLGGSLSLDTEAANTTFVIRMPAKT